MANSYDKLPIIGIEVKSEKEEKFLREIVNYEFLNQEEEGVMLEFSYGSSSNSEKFSFLHGGKYRVPRFIARWVESRTVPKWKWMPDGSGLMRKEKIGEKSRFQMREVFGG